MNSKTQILWLFDFKTPLFLIKFAKFLLVLFQKKKREVLKAIYERFYK